MFEPTIPYDQRLARVLIRPFVGTSLHPNAISGVSLVFGASAGLTFVFGGSDWNNLAVSMFMLAVFVDHMDGELARMAGKTSKLGYYLDYLIGSANYTILFSCLGIAFFLSEKNVLALWLGLAAGASNILIVFLRLTLEHFYGAEAVEHPSYCGFEIEDFIYLIGPASWLGGLDVFFWLYAFGNLGYFLWTIVELIKRARE